MRTTRFSLLRASLLCLIVPSFALAQQDAGTPRAEGFEPSLYPGAVYSPYAERDFPSRVFWGETHLHTGLSLDAGLFGNTTGHDTAYRLARGEQVTSATGQELKLSRPLDFLVVADHSDMMGIATDIQSGAPNIVAIPEGKEWPKALKKVARRPQKQPLISLGGSLRGPYLLNC